MIDKLIDISLKGIISYSPAEYVTLLDAVNGKLNYKLNNGDIVEFDKEQIDKFSSRIPPYLWALVKLPIVIIKSTEVGTYTLNGNEWNRKAIDIILGKDTNGILTTGDLERLLRDYDSIIFITLSISLINLKEEISEGQ